VVIQYMSIGGIVFSLELYILFCTQQVD